MSKVFSESRSKIHIVSDDNSKVYTFDIPSATSLGEAYDILGEMREIIWKRLEEMKKEEKENKCKAALHENKEEQKEKIVNKESLKETLLKKEEKQ